MSHVKNYMLTTLIVILAIFLVGFNISKLGSDEKLYCVYLMQWKDSNTEPASMTIESKLKAMLETVEGMESYEMMNLDRAEWDQLSVLTFASEEALESFKKHPDYRELEDLYTLNTKEIARYEYKERISF